MMHLHLTLAHSKGQCQGHAHFDCEYKVNSDRANITIADPEKVVYWLLKRVFTFDLGPFYMPKSMSFAI